MRLSYAFVALACTCKWPLAVNITNQTCPCILPEVEHAVLTCAQAINGPSVVLTGFGAKAQRSGFENKFLSNIASKSLHLTSSLLVWQAAIWFEKARKSLCLHI